MAESDFTFVVSSGPKLPKDPAIRTAIRKQAMKDVALARRQKGNYGRTNLRQYPTFNEILPVRLVPTSTSTTSCQSHSIIRRSESSGLTRESTDARNENGEIDREKRIARDRLIFHSIFASINLNPEYERTRIRYGVDLTDLAILTTFNIGRWASHSIAAEPSRLASLLGEKQWSYLDFVPSRYGTSEHLTSAVDCVLAKVHSKIAPSPKTTGLATCNQLYGKALRSLQTAIADEASCLEADVLCAVQLLSLHELLDPTRDTAWSHHVRGCARLIRHRSPDRFKSDFEKALFAAHVGGILSEALVTNMPCYLEFSPWSDVYSSIAQDSNFLTDRSSLTISLRKTMFKVPGIWHDIDAVVNSSDFLFDSPLTALDSRCRQIHQELLSRMDDYEAHCAARSLAHLPATELAIRRELLGNLLECLLLVKRLSATVRENERRCLEVEVQTIAQVLLDLQRGPSPKHSWLFRFHEVGMSSSIFETKEQWEEDVSDLSPEEQRLATRTRYNTWSSTLRIGD